MKPAALALLPALLAALAGCVDPVHDDLVASLGPEDPAVPPGPLHRPGQPCLACHDGAGPGSLVMVFGGTVFQDDVHPTPLVAATVELTDAGKKKVKAETNCAGNFFVQAVDWSPTYPVHAQILYGSASAQMVQHIGREGSCAACHAGKDSPHTVVHLYLSSDPMTFPKSGCK